MLKIWGTVGVSCLIHISILYVRYKKNKIPDVGHAPRRAMVPSPLIVQKSSDTSDKVKVDGHGWSIRYTSSLKTAAHYLKGLKISPVCFIVFEWPIFHIVIIYYL